MAAVAALSRADTLIAFNKITLAERELRPHIARAPAVATSFALLNRYVLIMHSEVFRRVKLYVDLRRSLFEVFKLKAAEEYRLFTSQHGGGAEAHAPEGACESFQDFLSNLVYNNVPSRFGKPRDDWENEQLPADVAAQIELASQFVDTW